MITVSVISPDNSYSQLHIQRPGGNVMNTYTECNNPLGKCLAVQESRSPRFNLPVQHPSKWRLVLERLLASPMRLHRMRALSVRMLEDTLDTIDCGKRK
jgi:hypothetical protein